MEAKRSVPIFCEDCTLVGVNFDPALNCGLYLPAVSLNPLPGQLRPVFELLPFVHLCILHCPFGDHR